MHSPLHIGILVERRYLSQLQPLGLTGVLQARGHRVTLIDPQAAAYQMGSHRWLQGLDLLVARGRSWELLCLLRWAEARGLPTVNRRAAIAAVHNKAEMGVALSAAGLPAPRSYLGPLEMLSDCIRQAGGSFPIVLKPMFGDNGRGLRLVRSETELRQLAWPEPMALAQEFVRGDGQDLKLYVIGEKVWAVRKASSLAGPRQQPPLRPPSLRRLHPQPLPVPPAWRDLARRCGQLFGLELYGLDCIETPSGLVVIEVNEFGNYTGVPAADGKLADYVLRRAAERSRHGRQACELVS
ncbi:MAG: RimK family alpha-L-glutamate ligase [Terriglobia bacterium]